MTDLVKRRTFGSNMVPRPFRVWCCVIDQGELGTQFVFCCDANEARNRARDERFAGRRATAVLLKEKP